jgi:SAM-dependent methyltransferase
MLSAFINANRRIAAAIDKRLPQTRDNLLAHYSESIADILNRAGRMRVIDAGAGKRCLFAEYLHSPHGHQIVGIDVSAEEIALNHDLTLKCIADISGALPFADKSIDMLVSHSVLEHLANTDRFFQEAGRILKPGGYFIHLCPSKFALFSVINQCLPLTLSRRILSFFYAESRGIGGFPTRYRSCYYTAIKRLLQQNTFAANAIIPVYHQSAYFGFFLPFYLLSVLYESIVRILGLKNLASHLVIISQKKGTLDCKSSH